MSGTDTGDVLCGTDVVKVVSVRQKILLTGTCWYELTGLWHLLSAQGHNVYRVPPGYPCVREGWDLIIVALSAEPVTGWGRHLSWIRERGFVSFVLMVVDSTVQKVKRIIYTDLSRSWQIKDVSALMHVSDSLLKKRLKSENSSFSQILLDMRMQKARVLINRGYSVSQTAALCGYASASYFICQFRKYFKITPFKYMHVQGEDKFCG
ncbi:helix-turn-helix domain-containing protein [Salmonella enterica]|nr:helix-turn-helix domain-containing protein [Salmonella enterica]